MKHAVLMEFVLLLVAGCGSSVKQEVAPGIWILDRDTPVTTYDELVDRLPRKSIYVDCWATWCAPCVEEFGYYKQLRPFLEDHHIGILYLNSDMGIDETTWVGFIKEHRLLGYHVRLNQQLQRDLIDQGYYNPRIPQFMIMDSSGAILEKNALRPSYGKALQEQLITLLETAD